MASAQQANQENRQYAKKPGPNKFSHTQNTRFGMGDYYGQAVRAKLGSVKDSMMNSGDVKSKHVKTPPRGLA